MALKKACAVLGVLTAFLVAAAIISTVLFCGYGPVTGQVMSVRSTGHSEYLDICYTDSDGTEQIIKVQTIRLYGMDVGDRINLRVSPEAPDRYMHAGALCLWYTWAFVSAGGFLCMLKSVRDTRKSSEPGGNGEAHNGRLNFFAKST